MRNSNSFFNIATPPGQGDPPAEPTTSAGIPGSDTQSRDAPAVAQVRTPGDARRADFEALIAEGDAVPVEGWDFSWFAGRATEQRPRWGYARLLSGHLNSVHSALDLQTGGGEVFGWALEQCSHRPPLLAATEAWPPNARLAKEQLGWLPVGVVGAGNDDVLPFRSEAFELVSSRHPVSLAWPEMARVLRPGGTFFSQMIGAGSNRKLYEYLMGPQPPNRSRSAGVAVASATAAGLQVVDLQEEALEVVFFDIGAVVHFLRKVPWTVPDFTVGRYHDRLAALHGEIKRDGHFTSHSQRFLIEARK